MNVCTSSYLTTSTSARHAAPNLDNEPKSAAAEDRSGMSKRRPSCFSFWVGGRKTRAGETRSGVDAQKGCAERIARFGTLSQNGYGEVVCMCTRSYLTTSTRPPCVAFDPDHEQKYTKMNFRRIDATWTFFIIISKMRKYQRKHGKARSPNFQAVLFFFCFEGIRRRFVFSSVS